MTTTNRRLTTADRQLASVVAVYALVTCVTVLAATCAKAPPTLSPAGTAAFQAIKVVKTLDVVRDIAISANEQQPPLISTDNTRKIVTWHAAALRTISAVPDGWKPTVLAGLDQLETAVPPAEWAHLKVYIDLLRVVIAEVTHAG